jgi:C_GCAxxG_C_C family probable redox protein
MDNKENIISKFNNGHNCAQCVLLAFSDELNLDKELAFQMTSGLGMGICHGEVCGAVNGAAIVLSLMYGPKDASDTKSKEKVYEKIRKFHKEFESRNGTILCRDLLGCDIGKEGMREYARESGLFTKVCPNMIRGAIEILETT